jgi:spermidine/putrescine transport system permease protein
MAIAIALFLDWPSQLIGLHQYSQSAMNPTASKPSLKISWQLMFTLLMYGFMYVPILILAIYSFNASRFSTTWEGFSLKWYQKLFGDARIFEALQDSLTVAFAAVGVSAILGTMMAVGLAKFQFPGKGLYRGVSYLPLIIPDIAIAVATLVFFSSLFGLLTPAIQSLNAWLLNIGFPLSLPLPSLSIGTVILAHVVFCLAYIAVVVSTRLTSLDPHLEEAALDLGATPLQAFIKVLLPELIPAILSGCLLAFILSMDFWLHGRQRS